MMTAKTKLSSSVADAIMAGLEEAVAYTNGQVVSGIRVTEAPDARQIRKQLGMSQNEFSAAFGIPSGTVKGWEQKRRKVDATAAALLRVIEKYPDHVRRAQEPTFGNS